MKKIILGILVIMFLFYQNVYAEEKVKVYMFSMSNVKNTEEIINEIENYEGYNDSFELVVLESCILNGNGKGKDKYTDNQKKLDKIIKDYNEAYEEDEVSRQYPIFLVGKDIVVGTTNLKKVINKNVEDENYSDSVYKCIIENKNENCFEKNVIKKDNTMIKTIIVIGGIFIITFFIIAFIFLLKK